VEWIFSGYKYVGYASVDEDISMDIHVKSVDYGYLSLFLKPFSR